MAYSKFDDIAAEKIGFYVYALRDPRNGVVFYVGKGIKNRWFDHIREARSNNADSTLKLDRIREIEASGHEVDAFIIRSGITNEKAAFDVEAAVIHAYKLLQNAGNPSGVELANIAEVHQPEKGLAHVTLAQTLFNAPMCPEILVPCALFKIPRLWFPEMSDEDVRQATLGWWPETKVKNGKKKAEYAFAVSKGIVRGIYTINQSMWRIRQQGDRDWENDIGKKPRWGFPECVAAPEMSEFLNTSVKHLFKKGDQNVVKFLNC